ncbi:MAG: peptide chain release factor N(5)-glutamine methyltransferase [Bacteroidales bacterium]|jgi:release factor glutamine methyltransferase|nr:peptide chain release factor N(5)-glutamine methyltransferase [Bacteroidales bacterium]
MRIPSNRIKDIKRFAINELKDIYSENEIKIMISQLISHFTSFDNIQQLISEDKTVLESDLLKLNFAIKDLKHNKPLQYIIGYSEFYNLRIGLRNNVLIPRGETEELVDLIIKENKDREGLKIVDLCTGSGAIALALKKNIPSANVWAVDNDINAINQARENSQTLGIDINILEQDILKQGFTTEKFDIIVSNPPYVMEKEKQLMKENVLDYEPHQALFVEDNNPLIFYKAIEKFSQTNLNPKGKVYLEINENLSKQTSDLFKLGSVEARKDINSKDRFVIVRFS